MLLGERTLPDFAADHVHVMTLHSVKGLEFPAVAVLGIGDLPWKSQTLEDAARLLYVAMTRATHALMISHSKPSALVERLLSI
jgi:superfamily I DNA/RNA helicase